MRKDISSGPPIEQSCALNSHVLPLNCYTREKHKDAAPLLGKQPWVGTVTTPGGSDGANLTHCDISTKGSDGRNVEGVHFYGSQQDFHHRLNHRAVSTRTIDNYKKHMVPFTQSMKVWAPARPSTTYGGSWWLWARSLSDLNCSIVQGRKSENVQRNDKT